MSTLQAVVFDMDGILEDSEVQWKLVRKEFVADNGLHWITEDQESAMGCRTAMTAFSLDLVEASGHKRARA